MLNVHRRGRIWWARGSVRGERVQCSLDTMNGEEARLRLQDLERQLYSGERRLLVSWLAFRQQFETHAAQSVRPRTLVKIRFVLGRFTRFLNSRQVRALHSISTALISDYCAERRRDIHPTRRIPVSAEGVKGDLRILHHAFAYAVAQRMIKENPVVHSRTSEPRRVTQPFSDDELARMLLACPAPVILSEAKDLDSSKKSFHAAPGGPQSAPSAWPRRPSRQLRTILLTFIHTGLRISDVIGLERREVDFEHNLILRRTEKRAKLIAVPLHPELRAALQSHLQSGIPNPTSRVKHSHQFAKIGNLANAKFHRAEGAPRSAANAQPPVPSPLVFSTASGRPLRALDSYLRRLWRRAGIPNAHAHRFRDTFSVRLLRQGASLYDLAMMLGITVAIAEKHYAPYVRILQERGRELVESLAPASPAAAQPGTMGVHKQSA